MVQEAWSCFNNLRTRFGKFTLQDSWEDVILESWILPLQSWKLGSKCKVNLETPWDILICTLLWYLWCQRCGYVHRDVAHHLGVALNRAWRATVHVSIATWRNIEKFPTNMATKKHTFKMVWSSPFCDSTQDPPRWNYIPHQYFVPKHLASCCRHLLSQNRPIPSVPGWPDQALNSGGPNSSSSPPDQCCSNSIASVSLPIPLCAFQGPLTSVTSSLSPQTAPVLEPQSSMEALSDNILYQILLGLADEVLNED